jgi:hypothetical protein
MAVTINASTSAGLVQTADTSGVLQLQTNSGTTALTIDTSQNTTFAGKVASAGALTLASNGTTTALTIDTSQNVGIGTTSPSTKLNLNATTAPTIITEVTSNAVGDKVGELKFYSRGVANNWGAGIASFVPAGAPGIDNLDLRFYTSTGATLNTERMRIDNSGNLLVATTTQLSAGRLCVDFNQSTHQAITLRNTNAGNGANYILFLNSASNQAGLITQTGATTVSYTTSSDYRLKENIVSMTGALDKIAQLKPVTYNWKVDGSNGQGFIAHELQAVVPDCVVGEKDAVETYTDEEGNEQTRITPQGVDTSFLVATLTAAIQEMKAIIDAQSARITALENK